MVMRPLTIKAVLRPHLSASQEARKQPKKHPAWSVDAILADKSAFCFLNSGRAERPYLLPKKISFFQLCYAPQVYIRHERGQSQDTTNGADIEPEEHTTKACGTCHHERTPSVNLWGILLHGIVPDDFVEEARAHPCVFEGISHVVGLSRLARRKNDGLKSYLGVSLDQEQNRLKRSMAHVERKRDGIPGDQQTQRVMLMYLSRAAPYNNQSIKQSFNKVDPARWENHWKNAATRPGTRLRLTTIHPVYRYEHHGPSAHCDRIPIRPHHLVDTYI